MEISVELPIHNHPLYPSSRFVRAWCGLCGNTYIHGGYRCNDSECEHQVWFHKECAELSPPKINHLSHPKHPLLFTHHPNPVPSCDLCGVKVSWIKGEYYSHDGYSCSTCDFNLCLTCSRKPPPLTIEHPMFHEHPLVLYKDETVSSDDEYFRYSGVWVFSPSCKKCNKSIEGTYTFACFKCFVYIHVDCVDFSPQVSHPSHPNHPLMFIRSESLPAEADKTCIMCGTYSEPLSYHCHICNFTLCLFCWENSPPLAIKHPKTHQHELTLLSRRMSFTCNVCGMEGDRSPYLCLPCGFMVHRSCIDLPRVININRHDHRIYLTQHTGRGYMKCGVCRRSISQYYGCYSCSICPNYAVHSHCAITGGYRLWDGIELEGMPEDTEDISPFKVVGENLIEHFSHKQHNMVLIKDGIIRGENTRCEACILPVWSEPVYNCESCNFILHKTCANLPLKKRHVYHARQLTLCPADTDSPEVFECIACETFSTGFKYHYKGLLLDAKCGSFVEPLVHGSHSHPLYFDMKFNRCHACLELKSKNGLCCDECDFCLCFTCAWLPTKVKHICDEHPLSLCYGENVSGDYWCDICEGRLDSKRWFYTCSDCGVTVHMKCVLGEFAGYMPERRYKENILILKHTGIYYKVVPNSHSTRPLCSYCHSRCTAPFILKICDLDNGFICSRSCMYHYR